MVDDRQAEHEFEQARQLLKQRRVHVDRVKGTGSLISQIIARRGIAQQLSTATLQDAWRQLTSHRWPGRSQPGPLNRGRLEIVVADSVTNQEMNFEKTMLLKKLQELMPETKVTQLSFRVGSVSR